MSAARRLERRFRGCIVIMPRRRWPGYCNRKLTHVLEERRAICRRHAEEFARDGREVRKI